MAVVRIKEVFLLLKCIHVDDRTPEPVRIARILKLTEFGLTKFNYTFQHDAHCNQQVSNAKSDTIIGNMGTPWSYLTKSYLGYVFALVNVSEIMRPLVWGSYGFSLY